MREPIYLLRTASIVVSIGLTALAIKIYLDGGHGPTNLVASALVSFALGTALATTWFIAIQSREKASALSMALNRSRIASRMTIGTIGARILTTIASGDATTGRALIDLIEKLAVSHADSVRLAVPKEERGDMAGATFRRSPDGSKQDAVGVATDGHGIVVRRGQPADRHAIIDGPYRVLIIRDELPASVGRSLISRVRQGPFPLSDVVDETDLGEACGVIDVYLGEDEMHLILEPALVPWRFVRQQLDPTFVDDADLPATRRVAKLIRSLWGRR